MIVPIHGLKYHKFSQPQLKDKILLVKEKNNLFDAEAIAAYTLDGEKVGYVSAKSSYNSRIYTKIQQDGLYGIVWAIFPNQILIELDFPIILPQKNTDAKKRKRPA